ncbi:hypothetical protein [Micromonospora echinofusca]|uniref:Uncharacterized protein n=1 Tax=Micromonospora echinofusca TaxID=47858 RepID=A0ABS3VMK9_MICEH|nr:hypothetical protein [Micromonospora echinofusca]MBO4205653.1 hypothetical protein [Micromonospora echinofusca]
MAVLGGALTLTLAVAPAGAAPAHDVQATASQLLGFTVGMDGRVYAASPTGLSPFTSYAIAPPGAGVSAVRQSDGNAAVFTIGTNGGLFTVLTSSATSGTRIVQVGPSGLASPGGRVNAVTGLDGSIHVAFPGRDGAVYAVSFSSTMSQTSSVQRASATGVAPSNAVVAAAWVSGVPGAVFVGSDGALHSVWRTGTGTWTTVPASAPGLASPGAGVAAIVKGGTAAYVSGLDGRLWQVGVTASGGVPDPWDPVAVTGTGVVPVGARLAATRFDNGPTNVLFAGADGAIRIVTNQTGSWVTSVASGAGVAQPGGPVAALAYGDYLYSDWCGNDLWWWFWWKRPLPPPPPPPWYGETDSFPTTIPVRSGYEVAVALYR